MKHSFLVLISLFGLVSPSLAMLDDPLVETTDGWGAKAKDLRPQAPDPRFDDPRYNDRSAVNDNRYPKMTMVHPYTTSRHCTPCSAAFLHARAPHILEDYYTQHLSDHEKIYSFVAQSLNYTACGLEPQFFVHPDAPRNYEGKDYHHSVRWTAVPGGQGRVEPRGGSLQTVGLLSAEIYTHHSGDADGRMGISDSVLALKGIDIIYKQLRVGVQDSCLPSRDVHSLVAFEDQGRKIAAFTYSWLLSQGFQAERNHDKILFMRAVDNSNTFLELITNLEPIGNFKNLLPELKQYVRLLPRTGEIDAPLQPTDHAANIENLLGVLTITTDHNASASYQVESNRFPITSGKKIRVPYKITVEEGGQIAFGLLNTYRNGWFGDELQLGEGSHEGIYERTVPPGETECSLVFRNYHLGIPGQTTFTINSVNIEKEVDETPVDIHLNPTAHPTNILHKKQMRVITDNNANASYQLESNRFPVEEGDKIRVPYEITVEPGGKMSLGLLSSSRTWWYGEEIVLEAGFHKDFFERIVSAGETETSLVLRNYHLGTPGQTIFTIEDLKIMKEKSI